MRIKLWDTQNDAELENGDVSSGMQLTIVAKASNNTYKVWNITFIKETPSRLTGEPFAVFIKLLAILRARALVPYIGHINNSKQNTFGLNVNILLLEFGGSQEIQVLSPHHNRQSIYYWDILLLVY